MVLVSSSRSYPSPHTLRTYMFIPPSPPRMPRYLHPSSNLKQSPHNKHLTTPFGTIFEPIKSKGNCRLSWRNVKCKY